MKGVPGGQHGSGGPATCTSLSVPSRPSIRTSILEVPLSTRLAEGQPRSRGSFVAIWGNEVQTRSCGIIYRRLSSMPGALSIQASSIYPYLSTPPRFGTQRSQSICGILRCGQAQRRLSSSFRPTACSAAPLLSMEMCAMRSANRRAPASTFSEPVRRL